MKIPHPNIQPATTSRAGSGPPPRGGLRSFWEARDAPKLIEGRQAAAKCSVDQIGARQDVAECLARLNKVSRISASAPPDKPSIAGPEPIVPVAAYIDSRPSFTSSRCALDRIDGTPVDPGRDALPPRKPASLRQER